MELKRKASTARWRAGYLCGLWLLGWSVLLGACRDSVGTALYVTIDFPSSLTMDQLRVSGSVDGNDIPPHFLPEQPERTLTPGDTFRVLLSSVPDKTEAALQVAGLFETTRVALGETRVEIREGSEVDVTVRLEPISNDFCPNCPEGCCMSGICTAPTFSTCGTGGVACVTCDPHLANMCDARGVCTCGVNAACDARSSDRCVLGWCRCGTNASCGQGQVCVSGQCVCTPDSCNGCCAGNICHAGNEKDRCGQSGQACDKCTSKETCSNGQCT